MDADPHGVSPAAWVRVSARIAFFTFCRFHRSAVRLLDTVRSSGTSISKRCLMAAPSCRVCGASAPVRVRAVGSPAPAPPGRGRSERRGVVATAGAAAGPGVAALLAAVAAAATPRGALRLALRSSPATLATVDLLRLRGRVAEAGADLVDVVLDAVAVGALAVRERSLHEPALRDHAGALLERLRDVLRRVPPDRGAEEQRLAVDPLVPLLVEGARRGRDGEVRDSDTRLGEAELGVGSQVADHGDGGVVRHVRRSP